ncbi:hypothetical protein HPB52_018805 [Rhipicephalus sanguineus]|uniref:Uncharacterized protein n=1 Tax=Rhipicephalus sanguineus TaxID=34632 RepID=A0A9D4PTG2_RHISA|nr:hypothetical protein HPB52_018805 [Rhipicephalus sanguineus]
MSQEEDGKEQRSSSEDETAAANRPHHDWKPNKLPAYGSCGSGDMNVHLNALQNQMASKGGYEYALPVNVSIPVVDVQQ